MKGVVSAAVLDGQRVDTTLTVTKGKVRVTRMTITGGNAAGGVRNSGTLTLIRVGVNDNRTGGAAAGILNDGTAVLQT